MGKTSGEKIKELRLLKGLSQDELCKLVGISQSTLQRLERNEFKRPPVDVFEKLAIALGVNPGYLTNSSVSHLPEKIRDFATNPENAEYIEWAYIKWKEKQLKEKINS